MSRKAIRTTYGTQLVGGVEVKRLIVAGQNVPVTITAPPGTFEDDAAAAAEADAKLTSAVVASGPQSVTTEQPSEPATATAAASTTEGATTTPTEPTPGASTPGDGSGQTVDTAAGQGGDGGTTPPEPPPEPQQGDGKSRRGRRG